MDYHQTDWQTVDFIRARLIDVRLSDQCNRFQQHITIIRREFYFLDNFQFLTGERTRTCIYIFALRQKSIGSSNRQKKKLFKSLEFYQLVSLLITVILIYTRDEKRQINEDDNNRFGLPISSKPCPGIHVIRSFALISGDEANIQRRGKQEREPYLVSISIDRYKKSLTSRYRSSQCKHRFLR